jgi:hypothetical protein
MEREREMLYCGECPPGNGKVVTSATQASRRSMPKNVGKLNAAEA